MQQSPYYAGYWQSGRQIEYNMFWCLLHDTTGVSAWTTPIIFYNDFTYSEVRPRHHGPVPRVQARLWDLIRSGQWQHDGIAIHYSQDAINAAQLAAKEEEQKDVRDVWVKLIEDLGLQYNFVATQQIEGGHAEQAQERLRALQGADPAGVAGHHGKERAAIEEFVKGGGTVIGDLYTASSTTSAADNRRACWTRSSASSAAGSRLMQLPACKISLPGVNAPELKFPVVEGLAATTASAGAQVLRGGEDPGAAFPGSWGRARRGT